MTEMLKRHKIKYVKRTVERQKASVEPREDEITLSTIHAIKGLEASQAKSQMLDFFGMDAFGEPKYDLNNQLTVKKFQELFLAFFSKGVLAERQPGISAALVSDAGFKVVKKVEAVDKDGVVELAGLPARNDVMYVRAAKIRDSEYEFIDIVDEQFDNFYKKMRQTYSYWRQYSYELTEYNNRIQQAGSTGKRVINALTALSLGSRCSSLPNRSCNNPSRRA